MLGASGVAKKNDMQALTETETTMAAWVKQRLIASLERALTSGFGHEKHPLPLVVGDLQGREERFNFFEIKRKLLLGRGADHKFQLPRWLFKPNR